MVAHRRKIWRLIGWTSDGSLDDHVVAYWRNMRWFIGWTCGGSLDEHVVAHLMNMWRLIVGRCYGSLVQRYCGSFQKILWFIQLYWMNMWWFAGLTCGGSLDEHMEDHWFEEWWLIGWTCGGSFVKIGLLVEDVEAYWQRARQLSPWVRIQHFPQWSWCIAGLLCNT